MYQKDSQGSASFQLLLDTSFSLALMGSHTDEKEGLPVNILVPSSPNLEYATPPEEYRLYKRRFVGLVGMVGYLWISKSAYSHSTPTVLSQPSRWDILAMVRSNREQRFVLSISA